MQYAGFSLDFPIVINLGGKARKVILYFTHNACVLLEALNKSWMNNLGKAWWIIFNWQKRGHLEHWNLWLVEPLLRDHYSCQALALSIHPTLAFLLSLENRIHIRAKCRDESCVRLDLSPGCWDHQFILHKPNNRSLFVGNYSGWLLFHS